MSFASKRFLGLELGGAKNRNTTLAVLEYYPNQNKTFLLDVFENIGADEGLTSDQFLLAKLQDCGASPSQATPSLGVNVPLSFPPCTTCTRKVCPLPERCTVPAVKWMREIVKKSTSSPGTGKKAVSLKAHALEKSFTPYTQRPVEIWLKHKVLPLINEKSRFEIDETLGGTKAALTARMAFLQRHLKGWLIHETIPKLTIASLAAELSLPARVLATYRHLEKGVHSRSLLIEAFAKEFGVFVYDRESRRLANHLGAFNAFLSAFTALLASNHKIADKPLNFPDKQGWITYPEIET